ncbi:putative ribonuclease H-like domain-containing protein [Tanacetum coccineum]
MRGYHERGDEILSERNRVKKERRASNKEDDQHVLDYRAEIDNCLVKQKEVLKSNNAGPFINIASVSTAGPSINTASENINTSSPNINTASPIPNDSKANLNNLENTMNISPIPTTKIHKDHPKDQIIGDINSATQTRRMTKISEEHAMVYRNKTDKRGIVVRNKTRLVAQGYTQKEGINYDEVFAPVARIEAIRLFLAYASFIGLIVYQMDEKSAFLYGTIEEEVSWYETLSTYLLENGYRRGTIDKTLFIKKDKGDILLVQVYVDDIIFGSTKKSLCVEFKQMMHKRFQMSSMGELTFFLGL